MAVCLDRSVEQGLLAIPAHSKLLRLTSFINLKSIPHKADETSLPHPDRVFLFCFYS